MPEQTTTTPDRADRPVTLHDHAAEIMANAARDVAGHTIEEYIAERAGGGPIDGTLVVEISELISTAAIDIAWPGTGEGILDVGNGPFGQLVGRLQSARDQLGGQLADALDRAAAAEAARIELVDELATITADRDQARDHLNRANISRQLAHDDLDAGARQVGRLINQVDELRQQLAQARDAGHRQMRVHQAATEQHTAEWAHLRRLLAPYDDDEEISVATLRDYLRRGPGLIDSAPAQADPAPNDRDEMGPRCQLRDLWTRLLCGFPADFLIRGQGNIGYACRTHVGDATAEDWTATPLHDPARDARLAAIVADALRDAAEGYPVFSADRAGHIAVQALADAWAFGPGARCTGCGEQLPRATGGSEPVQCQDCWLDNPNGEPTDGPTIPDPWRPVIEAAVAWRAGAGGPVGSGGVRNLAEAVDELFRAWPGVDLSVPAVSIAEVHAEQQELARGVAAVVQVDPLGLRERLELAAEQPPTADGDAIAFRVTCATKPSLCTIAWHNHPAAGQ